MTRLLVVCLLIAACDAADGGSGPVTDMSDTVAFSWTKSPKLKAVDPPFDIGSLDADFVSDIPCGPTPSNVFDIFLPDSEEITPIIVFIHGGGFVGGDKDELYEKHSDSALKALEHGIAIATINYRLLDPVDAIGVHKPLKDSAHCLQFIRYHGDTLNIDPDQVALMGVSAGAGTSLWLGFYEDLADLSNENPVFRESTRVRAVAAFETQATYDLIKWSTVVFKEYGVNLIGMAELMGLEQTLLSFYGVTETRSLETPEIIAYRKDVDMLILMTEDDSPIWINNQNIEPAIPLSSDIAFHHPNHAKILYEQARSVGLEVVADIPELDILYPEKETAVDFIIRHLD